MPPLHMPTRVDVEINLAESSMGFELRNCIFPAVILNMQQCEESCHNCFNLCDLRGVHVDPVPLQMIQNHL
eukprot:10591153-Ditylum_brightwellii.AAC.1